jgi:hypothetical protein
LPVAFALDFAVSIPFLDRRVEPLLDQLQNTSVHHSHPHARHQLVVWDAVEVAFHVRIDHRAEASGEVLADDFQRVVRASPGSEPVRAFQKVRFENRLQYQKHRRLNHPVSDVRDAQRPQFPVGFGNIHPPHRSGAVGLVLQLAGQLFAFLLDLFDGHSIDPRSACVGADLRPRCIQRLGVTHQPVKAVEAVSLLLFGFRTQVADASRRWILDI